MEDNKMTKKKRVLNISMSFTSCLYVSSICRGPRAAIKCNQASECLRRAGPTRQTAFMTPGAVRRLINVFCLLGQTRNFPRHITNCTAEFP